MSTSTKFSASQKGLAPILIVIFVALALGGYLVYSHQTKPTPPQPTSSPSTNPEPNGTGETVNPDPIQSDPDSFGTNWRTSKNDYFSLKYPPKWVIKDTKNPNSVTTLADITLTKRIPETKENKEILFLARTYSEEPGFTVESFNNKQKVVIDGITGFRSSGYGGEAGIVYKTVVQFTRGSIEYYILENNYNGTDIEDFNYILSTFKFTN